MIVLDDRATTIHRPLLDMNPRYRFGVSCCGQAMTWRGDVAQCDVCGYAEGIDQTRKAHGLTREDVYA